MEWNPYNPSIVFLGIDLASSKQINIKMSDSIQMK